MKKSISKRFKFTKNGKLLRRKMAQDHFKIKKSGQKNEAKRKTLSLDYPHSKIIKLGKTRN